MINNNKTDGNRSSFVVRLAVFLVGLFAFLQVYSVQAILPVLVHDFAVSEAVVGFAVGVTVLAIALLSPFVGILSDGIGRKIIIVPAIIGLALPTLALSWVPDMGLFNVMRFLQGVFVPAMTVVLLAYIAEEFPQNVAAMTATYVAGTVLGGFLGRFVLGYLNDYVGWRVGFLVMGSITLVGALVVALFLPNSRAFIKNTNQSVFSQFWMHCQNRQLLLLCFLGGCVLFSLVGVFTFVNLHLSKPPYMLSSSQLANLFAIYLIGMVITPLSAHLIVRYGSQATLFLAIGLSMLGAILTLMQAFWGIVLGLALVSTGVFITQTATISKLSTIVHSARSLANGMYYGGYYLGGMMGSWVCGLVFVRYQWVGVVLVIVLVQMAALSLVYLVSKITATTA